MIYPQIAKYNLPQIAKYDLPQIVCTIYPPWKYQGRFTPKITKYDLPPPNRPILSKISNAHNIMLCFTKVFSAKDQKCNKTWTNLDNSILLEDLGPLHFPALT